MSRRSCRTRRSTPATKSRCPACSCAAARSRSWSTSTCPMSSPIPKRCTGWTISIPNRKADCCVESVEAGEREDLRRIVLVSQAEAHLAAVAQDHLLAAQNHLGLALHGDVGPVGAMVDQHEFVAAALDA